MAKTKTKTDKDLYGRLRDSGIRKRVAKLAAEAVPSKGQQEAAPRAPRCRSVDGSRRNDQGARGWRLTQALAGRQEGGSDAKGQGEEAEQFREEGRAGPRKELRLHFA